MRRQLVLAFWDKKFGHYTALAANDSVLSDLIDAFTDSIHADSDECIAWINSANSPEIESLNAHVFEKRNGKIVLYAEYDYNEERILTFTPQEAIFILEQWKIMYEKKPEFFLISCIDGEYFFDVLDRVTWGKDLP